MDSQIELQQTIVDGAIRSVNFFNGRMLTARDLTREQTANREMDRRMGQAVGEGIAYGFEVSAPADKSALLTVEPGLAVNRQGQTLWLQDQTQVTLVRKASASTATKIFGECHDLQSGTYIAGAGIYLFTVAPAETREGRAVTSALNTGAVSCNTDTLVSGLQFRLIQIDLPLTVAELSDINHLRNLIAYKCFGVADTQSFVKDPFGAELTKYGLLDSLRPNLLTDCDVPLGVLYWTLSGGIQFLDMWSVRRNLAHRSPLQRWHTVLYDRRAAEGTAMFLQFQDQIESIRKTDPVPDILAATSRFRYLPPVGILPLKRGITRGFDGNAFFQGIVRRDPEEYIDGAVLNALVRAAVNYDPIDLTSGEMVWVYSVWQNEDAVGAGAQRYLVFTSAHVPYAATPRFDVSRWSYSNYAG
jgi:hypothetical protein